MTTPDAAATPAPDLTRRGGSGPEGRADRTGEYAIRVGDVLSVDAPEPPAGTEVKLSDGSRWKRTPLSARNFPHGLLPVPPKYGFALDVVWTWGRVLKEGPVTVAWLPPAELAELERSPEFAIWQDDPGQWRYLADS